MTACIAELDLINSSNCRAGSYVVTACNVELDLRNSCIIIYAYLHCYRLKSGMVRVGVVGFGHLGQYLVEKIQQNEDGRHRRRINTDENAKVVAAVWGTELIKQQRRPLPFLLYLSFFYDCRIHIL